MDARPPVTWALFKTYVSRRSWKLWSLFGKYWGWILRLALVIFLIDLILPAIGNQYVPPRTLHQPKAPYGLSLVDPHPEIIFPPAVE